MNVVTAIRAMCVLAMLSSACASDVAPPARGEVLWVDDRPEGNRREAAALHELGLRVTTATNNAQAVQLFRTHRYALVISDIHRQAPEPTTAGLALPAAMRAIRAELPPFIYYVGHVDEPYTAEGHPVVNQPTALLQFVQSLFPVAPGGGA